MYKGYTYLYIYFQMSLLVVNCIMFHRQDTDYVCIQNEQSLSFKVVIT